MAFFCWTADTREFGSCRGDGTVSGGGVPLGEGIVNHPSCCEAKTGLFADLCAQPSGPQGVNHDMNLNNSAASG